MFPRCAKPLLGMQFTGRRVLQNHEVSMAVSTRFPEMGVLRIVTLRIDTFGIFEITSSFAETYILFFK